MIPIEVDRISLFIDKLARQAHLGLFGEKPLAIIAAIKFINSGFIEGRPVHNASLTELLKNTITANAIKSKFMDLNKKGKLKAPDWSWSNIVSSKAELVYVLKEHKSVDESFRNLTNDETSFILQKYYEKMGLKLD